jgi:hypothetical protein
MDGHAAGVDSHPTGEPAMPRQKLNVEAIEVHSFDTKGPGDDEVNNPVPAPSAYLGTCSGCTNDAWLCCTGTACPG